MSKSKKNRRANHDRKRVTACKAASLTSVDQRLVARCMLERLHAEHASGGIRDPNLLRMVEEVWSDRGAMKKTLGFVNAFIDAVRDAGFATDPVHKLIVQGDTRIFGEILATLMECGESFAGMLALFLARPTDRFAFLYEDKRLIAIAGQYFGVRDAVATAMASWSDNEFRKVQTYWMARFRSSDWPADELLASAIDGLELLANEAFRRWGYAQVKRVECAARSARRM